MAPHRVNEDWVIERLDSFWPEHTAAFTRLLIALRQNFDDDLDAVVIIGAISTGMRGSGWQEILLSGRVAEEPNYAPTNTQSIAHVTGIARETVRRKLSHLETKGWVTRDEAGNWVPTGEAAEDLRPATLATIAYLRTVLAAAFHEDKASPDDEPASGKSRS